MNTHLYSAKSLKVSKRFTKRFTKYYQQHNHTILTKYYSQEPPKAVADDKTKIS